MNLRADLKPVGMSYLGAFLITNGSCVMVPIMFSGAMRWMQSFMQTHVKTMENLLNLDLSGDLLHLPLLICVCRVLVLWLS